MKKQLINKKNAPFTMVANSVINDKRLSLKAIGLFSYMYSKPEKWNFTLKSMASQMKDGADSIRSAILELKECGYLDYEKHNNGSGTYNIYYEPKPENPNLGNPNMGKSQRISNTDCSIKKESMFPSDKSACERVESEFERLWNDFRLALNGFRKNTDSKKRCKTKFENCYKIVKKTFDTTDDDIFDFMYDYLSSDWVKDKHGNRYISRLESRLIPEDIVAEIELQYAG